MGATKDEALDPRIRRRVGGPTLAMAIDVLSHARASRNWLVLLLLVITVLAVATAFVGQTVVPWAIYPAL